jgi:cell division protein FtsQ
VIHGGVESDASPGSDEHAANFVDPRHLQAPASLQESLEQESEAGTGVFARDSKIVDVKARIDEKAKAKRSRVLRKVLIIVGIVLAAVLVVWTLFFSPLCQVGTSNVSVKGTNRWVSTQQVSKLADAQIHKSLLLVSSSQLSESISKLTGVEDVSISKGFPNAITITVTPRTPKAIIKDTSGTLSVVDKNAFVIATVKKRFSGVPLIEVDNTGKQLTSRAVTQALSVLSQVPDSLLTQLTEVTAMTQDSVTTRMKDGRTIVWGNSSQMKLKSTVVQAILSDKSMMQGKSSIDVSAPERPILK